LEKKEVIFIRMKKDMNIINKLFTFFKKDENNTKNNIYKNLVILPEDIRYQMKYNKGII